MKKGHPWRLLKVAKDGNKELEKLFILIYYLMYGNFSVEQQMRVLLCLVCYSDDKPSVYSDINNAYKKLGNHTVHSCWFGLVCDGCEE